MPNKTAIIGAGASGLISAVFLGRKNIPVTIFEKNSKVGRKLLTTGNGRCNITNTHICVDNFHCTDPEFVKYPINAFDYNSCKKFFNEIGIEFTQGAKNRIYPMSLTASSVVDLLEYECIKNNVNIQLDTQVDKVEYKNGKYIINSKDSFDNVIVASGSIAMPKLGSSDTGYKIAQEFGHVIIEPFASLVQLVSSNKNLDIITGVKVDGIINGVQGDILFTKYGISGSAVLDISRDIAYELQYNDEVNISIDTMPLFNRKKLSDILLKRASQDPNKDIYLWLDGLMNKKLSRYIIQSSIDTKNIKQVKSINRKDIQKIAHNIKNLQFTITDTKGFDSCEVCAGGVEVSNVNNKTMESKLQKGLYFTGEVLDVDGQCGGYNLHFAWASGYLASKNIS
ncbi:MAG: NAD(P)/FAD-dependent oxidoreductase [Campylobacterota bacterium]|nr:NAD(P)/FAD-dependent oxidoreductase [Campylobacterota bacterium]